MSKNAEGPGHESRCPRCGLPLQVLMRSYFDGPLSFVVGLESPDGLYRLHMRLSGITWRLSAVDIPEPVTARLANLIAQRIGGAAKLPGG